MLTVVDVQLGFYVKSLSLHNVLNAWYIVGEMC